MTAEHDLSVTPRTRLGRHRERGKSERTDLHSVLDAGIICHLGVSIDGTPVVLPTAYGRRRDTLFVHGSSANSSLLAADGAQVCVTVTHLDGIVCARSVFNHSMNYRSAVIFGSASLIIREQDRLDALRVITEHMLPGRWDAARPPSGKELAATAVLAVPLDEASVKVRTGPPVDDPEDLALDTWAGVLPAALTFGSPQPDPAMNHQTPVPAHIRSVSDTIRGGARG
ncbi:MAG TPA: pyridoxamine 5'-phosphate oxidase family protein [Streptosporangiaceae bacterium]|nr:pyridoxamine 5'-phosphate oxidase family protein [Streptosporangiaceae bacterium]